MSWPRSAHLSPVRLTSLLFGLVAVGLGSTALALLATAGVSPATIFTMPDAHEPFLVFFLPSVFAGLCALLLWRRSASVPATCIALLPLCALVVAILADREWLIVATVFAAPTTALAIARTRMSAPDEA